VASPEDAEEPAHDVHALRRDAWINQQRILAAGIIAVHREGPRVPMATVATDAGVGIGTLYRRFPTRDALLDALTHRSFQLVLDNAHTAEAVDGTGLDGLDQFLDTTINHRDQLLLPLHGGPDITDNPTRALRSEVHQTLQRIIERGQQDGSIRNDATPLDVIIFGAMLAQPPPKISDWDHTAQRLKRIYIDGLAARRPEQLPP
jgi:AcrR family transcriptional regulator